MKWVSARAWLLLIFARAAQAVITKARKRPQLAEEPRQADEAHIALGRARHAALSTDPSESSATSGAVFAMRKMRSYAGPGLKLDGKAAAPVYAGKVSCQSTKWAVSTSIFGPTEAVKQLSQKEGWCTVVVGDKKGPQTGEYGMNSSRVVHISAEQQKAHMASFETLQETPWRSFGRKNLGYLFAMSQGADVIFDFDDDNVLLPGMPNSLTGGLEEAPVRRVGMTEGGLFANVYGLFEPEGVLSWPRGYALQKILPQQSGDTQVAAATKPRPSEMEVQDVTMKAAEIGVEQMLAQYNPDVDAIYRLTKKLPLVFEQKKAVVLEPGTYSPFNAQATLWHRPAFFAMLLPTSVNGRVSDILRSYISQPLLWARKLKLAFVAPEVEVTNRNPHDLIGDLNGEWPLYGELPVMVEDMEAHVRRNASQELGGPSALFSLYVYLYEHGLVEESDVRLAAAWTRDVLRLQKAPSKQRRGAGTVVALQEWSKRARIQKRREHMAARYFLGYTALTKNSGTDRLGNFLNEWFLLGTCRLQTPRLFCPGECHGRPGSTSLAGWLRVPRPSSFGGFLMSHLTPPHSSVAPLCGGEWWWSYSYENWARLGKQFQEDLRPLAIEYAKRRSIVPAAASSKLLVVHYRLGDKSSGTITPEALLRGIDLLYSKKNLTDPRSITVLAGSFNYWLHEGDPYKAECVRNQQRFMGLLSARFPGAHIKDQYADIDTDWLTMAFAPVLVTSHGSYAVSAAAVNTGLRATLGIPNLNFPKRHGTDVIPASLDAGRWLTYPVSEDDVIM